MAKRKEDKFKTVTRIIALILALAMVLSVAATLIYYVVAK